MTELQRRRVMTIVRVYKEFEGSPLAEDLSNTAMNGGRIAVESVADFDSDGGFALIDATEVGGTKNEVIQYGTIDEDTDELVDVSRRSPQIHSAVTTWVAPAEVSDDTGSVVADDNRINVEKVADGYYDDETVLAEGVPILPQLYPYFSLGERDSAQQETVWIGVVSEDDDQEYVITSPVGAVPKFDADKEVLPPDVVAPQPPIEEIPSVGKTITPPVILSAEAPTRISLNPAPEYTLKITYTGGSTYTDGTGVPDVHYRIRVYEGADIKWTVHTTSMTYSFPLVEPEAEYTIHVQSYSARAAATLSDIGRFADGTIPTVTVGRDATTPTKPTGLTISGGAGGGGRGVMYARWAASGETGISHYEIHAATQESHLSVTAAGEPVAGTPFALGQTLVANARVTSATIGRAWNGSSMATLTYTGKVYVRVRAVRYSGSKSPASDSVQASPAQAQSADVADLYSDDYFNPGTTTPSGNGWAIFKSGNVDFNNGWFRGNITAASFVASSTAGNIEIDGSTSQIRLGTNASPGAIVLDASDTDVPRIVFGEGEDDSISIEYTSDGGVVRIGADDAAMTLDAGTKTLSFGEIQLISDLDGNANPAGRIEIGSGVILNGAGGGSITVSRGTITGANFRTATTGSRIVIDGGTADKDKIIIYGANSNVGRITSQGGNLLIEHPSRPKSSDTSSSPDKGWLLVSAGTDSGEPNHGYVHTGMLWTDGLLIGTYTDNNTIPTGTVQLRKNGNALEAKRSGGSQWYEFVFKDGTLPAGVRATL